MAIIISANRTWGRNDNLSFGVYKGMTIGEVLTFDPSYLIWADTNIEWFHLIKDVRDEAIEDMPTSTSFSYDEDPMDSMIDGSYMEDAFLDCPYY